MLMLKRLEETYKKVFWGKKDKDLIDKLDHAAKEMILKQRNNVIQGNFPWHEEQQSTKT